MKKLNALLILLIFAQFIGCKEVEKPDTALVEPEPIKNYPVLHRTKTISGIDIFYREAGNPENPAILLLHGFPASSFQYRKVLAGLADSYYLIAPDYPSFGESAYPDPDTFEYSFDNLGDIMDEFVQSFNLDSYSLMMQDYGAPIGYRIIMKHPEKVRALIIQNGNAYEEGLGEAWGNVRALWEENSPENRELLYAAFTLEGLEWQYTHGAKDPEKVSPDNWVLDYHRMQRPKIQDMNIDLFYDYRNNIKLYPQWQKYLRDNQPPILIVWGTGDQFFPAAGAEAYKKDIKDVELHFYDTGHFALEEAGDDIIEKMRGFMSKLPTAEKKK